MKQDNLYQKLMDYQRGLKKVDTHEHISSPRYAQQVGGGIFEVLLTPYTTDSFFSAGCSRQEYDFMISDAPFSQRYEIFAKYWALCRYTAFARAAALSVQHNFGISDLSEQSLLEAEEKLACLLYTSDAADD